MMTGGHALTSAMVAARMTRAGMGDGICATTKI
jgi:hypothetical protein